MTTIPTVWIRRNADGETRMCTEIEKWDDVDEFMWSDGNYRCDCNRALFFYRAAGMKSEDIEVECGDDAFYVWIRDQDGNELYADEDFCKGQ